MLFLFGLGNPGRRYKYTLHNMGFWILDEIASKWGVSFKKRICNSRVAHFNPRIQGKDIYLVKPYTYMNLSGKAVFCFKNKYALREDEMLIICDDFTLEKGYIRIKPRGSSGGHNGLDSVIDFLGTEKIPRLRVGIGPLNERDIAERYVLRALSQGEMEEYRVIVKRIAGIIEVYIEEGIEKAMSFYNKKMII